MKNAKYFFYVFLLLFCFYAGQCPKVLDSGTVSMQETFQETNMWCWAASMQTILALYAIDVEQCEEANWLFGLSDCCSNPVPTYCVMGTSGSQQRNVLDHWGCNSKLVSNNLSWIELKTEIKEGRPINMGWLWCTSGGHSLNIYGFSEVKNGTIKYNVMYMDPWPGEGFNTADYDWVVGGCPGDHTWYRTLYEINRR